MLYSAIHLVNLGRLLILVTFIASLLILNLKDEKNKLLLSILSVSFATELAVAILIFTNNRDLIGSICSLSVIFHHSLWLLLLITSISSPHYLKYIVVCFFLFGIYNLYFLEGPVKFNYLTFIVGALLYIIIFIYQSFVELKHENFPFFQSNTYLLLFAPILFFFGMSFMFGFRSHEITSVIIFADIKLYKVINQFVNCIYYLLIICYIYTEKKSKA